MSLGMQEILPSGGLANFQNHVSQLADLGRYEDAYIAHLAEGETVVPMDVLNSNPHLKAMLFAQMRDMGIDPQRYIVGSEFNSINPVTGQPEFFLKKIFKSAKKTVKKLAPYAGLIAGAMGAGPMYSALAGGIGGLYGSGGDFGAGAMGALGGYGAGKAFGTSSWVPGTSAADANYVFGGGQGFEGSLGRMGENLGFGGPKSAGVDTEIAAKVGAPAGTTVEEIIAAGGEPYEKYSRLVEHGIIKNPASKMTNWEKGILFGLPIVGGLSGLFGDDEVQGPGEGWEDIHAKNPWYGRFGNTVMNVAEGGMIKNFDNGGDTTLTTQQQLELQCLLLKV